MPNTNTEYTGLQFTREEWIGHLNESRAKGCDIDDQLIDMARNGLITGVDEESREQLMELLRAKYRLLNGKAPFTIRPAAPNQADIKFDLPKVAVRSRAAKK